MRLEQLTAGDYTVAVRVEDGGASRGEPQLWPSIGEYPVYDETIYRTMSDDSFRDELFRKAIAKLASGKRVLDIGTGQDLNWAVASVRAGADHVTAMEAMVDTYGRAAEKLGAWVLREKVTLRHGMSTDLTVGARVQVCVSETIGSVAGAEGAAAVFLDARRRHLTADGMAIPNRCVTKAAAASFGRVMGRAEVGFADDSIGLLQKIFALNQRPFDVRLRIGDPDISALTSTAGAIEVLDFNGDLTPEQTHAVTLQIDRGGEVDGILAWMEMCCLPDLPILSGLDTNNHWGAVFFPLFDAPVAVEPGDRLELRSRILLSDDAIHPDYHFEAALYTGRGDHSASASYCHHGDGFRRNAIHRRLFPLASP